MWIDRKLNMKMTWLGIILLMLCSGCHRHSTCVQKIQQDSGAMIIVSIKDLVSVTPNGYPYLCQSPDGQVWLYDMSESDEIIAKYVLFRNTPPIYPEEPSTNIINR